MPPRHIGRFEHRIPNVAAAYLELATDDEASGESLFKNGHYRQAVYFLIQAMEKYVRHKIFTKVNPDVEFFRNETRTHNLDNLLSFLVKIVSSSDVVRCQIEKQLDEHVLGGVRFGHLHNNLRYVMYSEHHSSFSVLKIGKSDAEFTMEKLRRLKSFLDDIDRLGGV